MHAILLHGMGRTPLAMSLLAVRLRKAGIHPHIFGYSVTFEHWEDCLQRLHRFIEKHSVGSDFIIIGHSLGTVLTRAILPELVHKPKACFFLAPPTRVPRAARVFTHHRLVKWFMGEIGNVLTNEQFMDALPLPGMPTKIYAGVAGPRGRYSPFGETLNDGLLSIEESTLPDVPLQTVPILHTFIMNSKTVTQDIIKIATKN
ncbi:MAG TPA: alpha/beta hydrolase [Anaerolineales bacterium]|nr:alpha/beta hydrolase [Anaerolineales bacterium]HNN14697.1 alpha/beta hydrolase [Anaerolineales bacterium]HNO30524.1 alpha/beta hydrolase [Anaerolineales bacterium]